MIAELGLFLMSLALALALVQVVFPAVGLVTQQALWLGYALSLIHI